MAGVGKGPARGGSGAPAPNDDPAMRRARNLGVGCFTAFIGFVSGGMIGVFLSWGWAFLTRAPKCSGIPSCDWGYWATAGAWIGTITLPVLALWRLRRSDASHELLDRG